MQVICQSRGWHKEWLDCCCRYMRVTRLLFSKASTPPQLLFDMHSKTQSSQKTNRQVHCTVQFAESDWHGHQATVCRVHSPVPGPCLQFMGAKPLPRLATGQYHHLGSCPRDTKTHVPGALNSSFSLCCCFVLNFLLKYNLHPEKTYV